MSQDKPTKDYEVGKGRPPIEHRWKKGTSGNPTGRKKKPDTIADTLKAKLAARISVGEGGRRRSMTMQELILEQLIRDAAKADPRARSLLFTLMSKYEGLDEPLIDAKHLSREDQDLIDTFIANHGSPAARRENITAQGDGGMCSGSQDDQEAEAAPLRSLLASLPFSPQYYGRTFRPLSARRSTRWFPVRLTSPAGTSMPSCISSSVSGAGRSVV